MYKTTTRLPAYTLPFAGLSKSAAHRRTRSPRELVCPIIVRRVQVFTQTEHAALGRQQADHAERQYVFRSLTGRHWPLSQQADLVQRLRILQRVHKAIGSVAEQNY